MITTCTVCQARYQLDDEKIPARVIKVRCPACSGVFSLDGRNASQDEPLVTTGYPTTSAAPPSVPVPEPVPDTPLITRSPVPSAPIPRAPVASTPATQTVSSGVAVMDAPAPAPAAATGSRRRRSKEEMLARALVSDIKVYNRELYDTAKSEGNLLEALGTEIKKSWELYKEKVTPEVANSTDHFRDALNEILADGEKIF